MTVYIGMDLSGSFFYGYALDNKDIKLRQGSYPMSGQGIDAFLYGFEPDDTIVAFEAMTEAHWMDKELTKRGFETHPFHPLAFSVIAKSKRKTDKIDARIIAKSLKRDALPSRVYIPDGVIMLLRELVGERMSHEKHIRQIGNRIKALSRKHGIGLSRRALSNEQAIWQAKEKFKGTPQEAEVSRLCLCAFAHLQNKEDVEQHIRATIKSSEYSNSYRNLLTIPGVGPYTASVLLAYIGDGSRFCDSRHVCSYFGMVPTVRQSGDINRLGRITRTGPSIVRHALTQAAWAMQRTNYFKLSSLSNWHKELVKRAGKKRANFALARKILTMAYALLRDDRCWY